MVFAFEEKEKTTGQLQEQKEQATWLMHHDHAELERGTCTSFQGTSPLSARLACCYSDDAFFRFGERSRYSSSAVILSFALGALVSSFVSLELFGHQMMLVNAGGIETRTVLGVNYTAFIAPSDGTNDESTATHTEQKELQQRKLYRYASLPAVEDLNATNATSTANATAVIAENVITETPTPTICEYLLAEDSTDTNSTEPTPSGGVPPASVQAVLKSHCEIHPWLPLEELLPNMTFFEQIYQTVNNYREAHNATIDLTAGRGTTETTTTVLRWMGDDLEFGFVHWTLARCPPFFRNESDPVGGCIRNRLGGKPNDARYEARNKLMDHGADNATLRENEYGFILNALARDLDDALNCGDCGNMILSDSPWVNLFAEFYLALGPTTKVVLLRRDAHTWASQRRRRHKSALVCLDDTNLDPFSFTQCAARNAPAGRVHKIDYEYLVKSYQKYNQYVHSIVPENYLLDINLFTNSILGAENVTDLWSIKSKELMRTFLDLREDER